MVNWAKKLVSCKFARATAGVGGAWQTKVNFPSKINRKILVSLLARNQNIQICTYSNTGKVEFDATLLEQKAENLIIHAKIVKWKYLITVQGDILTEQFSV